MRAPEPSTRSRPRPWLRPGFTLLELVTVLIILAILAAVAIPKFGQSIAYRRAEAAAARVAADLAFARRHAIAASADQTVVFTPSQGRYELSGMKDPEHPSQAYIVRLSRSPYEASIPSADFGGVTELVFDGYGRPDSGGTVVVQAGNVSRTITVSAESGEAKIQ